VIISVSVALFYFFKDVCFSLVISEGNRLWHSHVRAFMYNPEFSFNQSTYGFS
jgi:hypothetical protein